MLGDQDIDFWNTISSCCLRPLNVANASARLEATLGALAPDDIREFCAAFDRRMEDAYTWDLWGVAYLINGGCSDDSFMDFRASLIGLGQAVFTSAVANAESVLDVPSNELEEMFEEGLLYCGPSAYEAVTGQQVVTGIQRAHAPHGEPWEEDGESLSQRFPRAWERSGWLTGGESAPEDRKPWWRFW